MKLMHYCAQKDFFSLATHIFITLGTEWKWNEFQQRFNLFSYATKNNIFLAFNVVDVSTWEKRIINFVCDAWICGGGARNAWAGRHGESESLCGDRPMYSHWWPDHLSKNVMLMATEWTVQGFFSVISPMRCVSTPKMCVRVTVGDAKWIFSGHVGFGDSFGVMFNGQLVLKYFSALEAMRSALRQP